MAICEVFDPDCYACRLRAKGLQFDATVVPKRRHGVRKARPIVQPSWEAGLALDRREGGVEMPIMRETGRMVHVKEAAEKRHQIKDTFARAASASTQE